MFKVVITSGFLFLCSALFAQSEGTFSITGKVISVKDGRGLSGASLWIDKNKGTTTDTAGAFSISGLKPGDYKLHFKTVDFYKKDTIIRIKDTNMQDLHIMAVPK